MRAVLQRVRSAKVEVEVYRIGDRSLAREATWDRRERPMGVQ